MMSVRSLSFCAAMLVASIANTHAAERLSYDANAFQAVLEMGKPILVHVTAPWCKQCNLQKPIVAEIGGRPDFQDLTIVDVDFDTQKDALRQLRVQKQSTLVIYKGKVEVDRAVGITRREAIETLMKKAL